MIDVLMSMLQENMYAVFFFFKVFICVCIVIMQSANGLGMQAFSGKDYCEVTMKFPSDTIPKWVSYVFRTRF